MVKDANDVQKKTEHSSSAEGNIDASVPAPLKEFKVDYGKWEEQVRIESEATFYKTVIADTENIWVVVFMSPLCWDCQQLAPEWAAMTAKFSGSGKNLKFGYVDATMN